MCLGVRFTAEHADTHSCVTAQYLLAEVQLLQDGAYIGAVLCVGAGFRGEGVSWVLGYSRCLTQNREERQMATILSVLLFSHFRFCPSFTQDFGVCYKGNKSFPLTLALTPNTHIQVKEDFKNSKGDTFLYWRHLLL